MLVPHLVRALAEHRKWCRSRGVPLPAAIETLLTALAASCGQQRPEVGGMPVGSEAGPVPTEPLLLDDAAAAVRLSISERSVRRLRANGALPTVMAGGRRLTRLADLEKFVENGGTR